MSNRITLKQYNQRKNELVSVISFKHTGGARELFYQGVDLFSALDHIQKEQKSYLHCYILNAEQAEKVSEYEQFPKAWNTTRIQEGELCFFLETGILSRPKQEEEAQTA